MTVLAVSRRLLVEAELTPARFDMLRVIHLHKHGIAQTKLCDLLGVSGATVSRMLTSLEKLGLISRERAYRDGRRNLVRITEFGITDVLTGIYMLLHTGIANKMAAAGVTGDESADPSTPDAREKVTAFERLLGRMRAVYKDRCPFPHPWRTGELVPMIVTTLVDGRLTYGASA